jgi:hypothetical protein
VEFHRNVGELQDTRYYVPEDRILHSHRRDNLKPNKPYLFVFVLICAVHLTTFQNLLFFNHLWVIYIANSAMAQTVQSNARMINEYRLGMGVKGGGRGPSLNSIRRLSVEAEVNHERINHDSWCPGRYSKQIIREYKSKAL